MIRLINIILILIFFNGCTWIARDYYYGDNNNQEDWYQEFLKGKPSDKQGTHPAKEILTYTYKDFELKLHISYQDMTVYGPIIVPIIPTPWDTTRMLTIQVEIDTKGKLIALDPMKWQVKDLSTRKIYYPNSINLYTNKKHEFINIDSMHSLEIYKPAKLYIHYPIKVSDTDEIEIDIESFSYEKEVLAPSPIKLKKVKGDWHFNQWTI